MCGEYGETTRRPHYHAILFNLDFDDRVLFTERDDVKVYTSEKLQSFWEYGHTTVGDCTFQSAAYVARYVTKKVTGDLAGDHYAVFNSLTGEITQRNPEYATMSRRPGIASEWYAKYSGDVHNHDYVVINGKTVKTPKAYDRLLESHNPEAFEKLKATRKRKAKRKGSDSDRRLLDRETVQEARLKQLKREL